MDIDQYPVAFTTARVSWGDLPFFATETGYSTCTSNVQCSSERALALYINRIFTEYFRLGIRRTCIYDLFDDGTNSSYIEDNFGMMYYNNTPKAAYNALKNLMVLVRSGWVPSASELRPPSYSLSSLNFTLTISPVGSYNRTDYVHHLLLQKPNGTLLLLIWHEISGEDTSVRPYRQVYPPQMPGVLDIFSSPSNPSNVWKITVFAPHDGPAQTGTYSGGQDVFTNPASISLSVPDHVLVLQFDEVAGGSSTTSGAGRMIPWSWLSVLC